jgi:hypothetical protein
MKRRGAPQGSQERRAGHARRYRGSPNRRNAPQRDVPEREGRAVSIARPVGRGVMAARQVLALLVEVRILAPQLISC